MDSVTTLVGEPIRLHLLILLDALREEVTNALGVGLRFIKQFLCHKETDLLNERVLGERASLLIELNNATV